MRAAKARGALVSLDLASFEVVRNCRDAASHTRLGVVDLLFANEDEAAELTGQVSSPSARPRKRASEDGAKKSRRGGPERAAEDDAAATKPPKKPPRKPPRRRSREDADAALEKMLEHCAVAVVSLGARGCVAKSRAGDRGVAPGVRVPVVDTTGAGDSFHRGLPRRLPPGRQAPGVRELRVRGGDADGAGARGRARAERVEPTREPDQGDRAEE